MKREARLLLEKALDSVVLSVEIFNRPWHRGRPEGALIFMDRALELFMKAALVHRGYRIRESQYSNTFGFEKCVNKCINEAKPGILTENEAVTVRLINGLRDAAQHYLIEVSERELYIYIQAAVTLLDDKLQDVFGTSLHDYLPERVLPISTIVPLDLESVIAIKLEEIKALLAPRKRKGLQAASQLRSLAVLEKALRGDSVQPTPAELDQLASRIRQGTDWVELFPGIANLNVTTDGIGPSISIRISKTEGIPARLVREGSPEYETAPVIAVKRVNELDYYSLGLQSLAKKLGLSAPRTLALIRYLDLQNNSEYYKEIRIGSQRHKRYSAKALHVLKRTLAEVDMDEVWVTHAPHASPRSSKTVELQAAANA